MLGYEGCHRGARLLIRPDSELTPCAEISYGWSCVGPRARMGKSYADDTFCARNNENCMKLQHHRRVGSKIVVVASSSRQETAEMVRSGGGERGKKWPRWKLIQQFNKIGKLKLSPVVGLDAGGKHEPRTPHNRSLDSRLVTIRKALSDLRTSRISGQ